MLTSKAATTLRKSWTY